MTEVLGLHHVQLAMPVGGEDMAVEFYEGLHPSVAGLLSLQAPTNRTEPGNRLQSVCGMAGRLPGCPVSYWPPPVASYSAM